MIQVMKKHLANQDIIVHACKALRSLAVNTKNQLTIANADGIPVRIDALVHHRNKSILDLVTLVFPPFPFSLPYP